MELFVKEVDWRHASAPSALFEGGMEVEQIYRWHQEVWRSHLKNISSLGDAHATFLNVGMLAQGVYLNALKDSGVNADEARQAIVLHKRRKEEVRLSEWCCAESDVEVTDEMALIKDAVLILEALYRGPRREAPIDINVARLGLSEGAMQNLRSLKDRSSVAPKLKGVIAKNSRRYAPRGMLGDARLVQQGGSTAFLGSQIQPAPKVNNGPAGEVDPHLAEIEQLLAEGAMQGLPPPPLHQAATPLPGRSGDAVMLNDVHWRFCDWSAVFPLTLPNQRGQARETMLKVVMAHFEQASVCEKRRATDGSIVLHLTESYESSISDCLKRDGPARDYHHDLRKWAQNGVNGKNGKRGRRARRDVHNLSVGKLVAMNNMLGLHLYSEFMLAIKDTRQAAYLPDLDISDALGQDAAKNIRPFVTKRSAAANGGACQARGSQPASAPARVRHACETDSEEEQETVSTAGDDGNQEAVHSSATSSAKAAAATGSPHGGPAVPAIAAQAGRLAARHTGGTQPVVKGPDGVPQRGSYQAQACVKRDQGGGQPAKIQASQPARPADRPSAAHGRGGAQRERERQLRSRSPLRGRHGGAAAEQPPERAAAAPIHVKVERRRGWEGGGSSAAQQHPARHAVDSPGSSGHADPPPLVSWGPVDEARGQPALGVKSSREGTGDRPRSEWAEGHSSHRAAEEPAGSARGRSLEQRGERPTSYRAADSAGGVRGTSADSPVRARRNVRGVDASVARGDKARGALKDEVQGARGDQTRKERGDNSRKGKARGARGDGAPRTHGEAAGVHRGVVRGAGRGAARPARRGGRDRRVSEVGQRGRDSPDRRDLRGKRRQGRNDRIPSPLNARQRDEHAHGRGTGRLSSPEVVEHQRQHQRPPSPTSLTWSSSFSDASPSPRRDPQVATGQSRWRFPAEPRQEHAEEACRVMPKQEAATKPWADSSMHDSGKMGRQPVAGFSQAAPAVLSGRVVAVAAPDVKPLLVKPFVAPAAAVHPPLPPDSPRSVQPPLPTGNPDSPQPPMPLEPTRSAKKRQGLRTLKSRVLSGRKPLCFDLAGMDGKLSAVTQASLGWPRLAVPQDASAAHAEMAVKEEQKPAWDQVQAAVAAVGHTPAEPADGCAAAGAEAGRRDSLDAVRRPSGAWRALQAARALAPGSRSGPKINANRPIVDIPAANDTGPGKGTKGHAHGGAAAAHHAGDTSHISISDMAFQNIGASHGTPVMEACHVITVDPTPPRHGSLSGGAPLPQLLHAASASPVTPNPGTPVIEIADTPPGVDQVSAVEYKLITISNASPVRAPLPGSGAAPSAGAATPDGEWIAPAQPRSPPLDWRPPPPQDSPEPLKVPPLPMELPPQQLLRPLPAIESPVPLPLCAALAMAKSSIPAASTSPVEQARVACPSADAPAVADAPSASESSALDGSRSTQETVLTELASPTPTELIHSQDSPPPVQPSSPTSAPHENPHPHPPAADGSPAAAAASPVKRALMYQLLGSVPHNIARAANSALGDIPGLQSTAYTPYAASVPTATTPSPPPPLPSRSPSPDPPPPPLPLDPPPPPPSALANAASYGWHQHPHPPNGMPHPMYPPPVHFSQMPRYQVAAAGVLLGGQECARPYFMPLGNPALHMVPRPPALPPAAHAPQQDPRGQPGQVCRMDHNGARDPAGGAAPGVEAGPVAGIRADAANPEHSANERAPGPPRAAASKGQAFMRFSLCAVEAADSTVIESAQVGTDVRPEAPAPEEAAVPTTRSAILQALAATESPEVDGAAPARSNTAPTDPRRRRAQSQAAAAAPAPPMAGPGRHCGPEAPGAIQLPSVLHAAHAPSAAVGHPSGPPRGADPRNGAQAHGAGGPNHRSAGAAPGTTAHLNGQNQTAHRVPAVARGQGAMPAAGGRVASGEGAPGTHRAGSALPPPPPPAGARNQTQQGSSKLGKWQGEPRPVVPSRKLGKGAVVQPKKRAASGSVGGAAVKRPTPAPGSIRTPRMMNRVRREGKIEAGEMKLPSMDSVLGRDSSFPKKDKCTVPPAAAPEPAASIAPVSAPPSAIAGPVAPACPTADKPQTPTQAAPRSYSNLFVQLGLESPHSAGGVQALRLGATEPAEDAAAPAARATAPDAPPQNAEAVDLPRGTHAAAAPSQGANVADTECGAPLPSMPGSKRVLQGDPPFHTGAEESASKSSKLHLTSSAAGHAAGAAAGGDGPTAATTGDGRVDTVDGDGQAAVPAATNGEVRLRDEVSGACLRGWGPLWALAIREVARTHNGGSGALACGEACLAEVQDRIRGFADAADAAAAASGLMAPVDSVGRPADKVEVVLEHVKAGDGGAAGLADPMVMVLLQQHAPGEPLRLEAQAGLQDFVAQCEQSLMEELTGTSRSNAVCCLHALACLLRAYVITDSASDTPGTSCAAVAFCQLLIRTATSPNVAHSSGRDDMLLREELPHLCKLNRLLNGMTAVACAEVFGYTDAAMFPRAGVVAAALLVLSIHRDLCAALWAAVLAALLGLPAPLESLLSGIGSACSQVVLLPDMDDMLLFRQSVAAQLRERPAARELVLDVLGHACSPANTGLAVSSHTLVDSKTLQHVGQLAHQQLPLAQRAWARAAMRVLYAVRATPGEVLRVLGPTSLPLTSAPADCAGGAPSVLHGVPQAMLQFSVPAVDSDRDDAEGDSVARHSLGGTLGVPDVPVQFALIESMHSDAAVEGGQLQAHSSLLSACMLHMHVYAATTDARPATVFRTAPEDNEALDHCGEWLVPLQCASLLQATVALASTPEAVLEACIAASNFGFTESEEQDMAGVLTMWLHVRGPGYGTGDDLMWQVTTDLLAAALLVVCGRFADAFALSRAAVTALAAAAARPSAPDLAKVLLPYAAEMCAAIVAARWHAAGCGSMDEGGDMESNMDEMAQDARQLLLTVARGLNITHSGGDPQDARTASAEEAHAWGHRAWLRLVQHLAACLLLPPDTADGAAGGSESAGGDAAGGDAADRSVAVEAAVYTTLEASMVNIAGRGSCAMLVAWTLAAAADVASVQTVFKYDHVQALLQEVMVSDAGVREMLHGLTPRALPAVVMAAHSP